MNQAQNVTTRGTQMARNAAAVFAFRESLFDITSYTASKKRRTQIVMTVPTKISLCAIAGEVLDERLLTLEPLEGSVAMSDITRTTCGCQYKRFSRCSLHGSHRALYCYFEPYCSAAPSDFSRQLLVPTITNEGWRWDNTRATEERATEIEPKTLVMTLAELIDRNITDQTIFLTDGYTSCLCHRGRSARKVGDYSKPIRLRRTSILEKHRAFPHTAKTCNASLVARGLLTLYISGLTQHLPTNRDHLAFVLLFHRIAQSISVIQ
jgi:hypothetical protein